MAAVSRIRREPAPSAQKPSALWKWLPAAPALLTIAGVLLLFVCVSLRRTEATAQRYSDEAAAALESRDFRTARLCYGRLLQSRPTDPAVLFGLARSLDGLGQTSASHQILQKLAPPTGSGYAPAHLFLAEQLLDARRTPETAAQAEQHLQRVLETDPSNAEASGLLEALRRSRPQR